MSNILFIGGGALGAFYASRFAMNAKVSIVCRSNYEIVKKSGFKLKTLDWGECEFIPHEVFQNSKEAGKGYDHVFITTKALPSIDPVSLLNPVIDDKTMIHLIQNGIGIETKINTAFPNNALVSGVSFIGVVRNYSLMVEKSP
jgi:2-dehydropantoate 2-reductase